MSKIFSNDLLRWFDKHGRKDLPWQHPRSSYFVWLSEIMLQQTQVNTVIPYFQKFIRRFPEIFSLAKASQDEVLTCWAGLGYYSRARNLHKAAQKVVSEYQGQFPNNLEALQKLPGIGRSTAGAILAQAFNQFGVILDGNVKRVLSRYYATYDQELLWKYAEENTPKKRVADYAQAIMDLGALICTRTKPKCIECPLQPGCKAFQTESISQFPAVKKRKPLPIQARFFVITLNDQQKILLERQPSPGIWGGLWSLPSVMALEELTMKKKAEILPPFIHTFTHFKLQIKPVVIRNTPMQLQVAENLDRQWISQEQLHEIALPAPIKRLLYEFSNTRKSHKRYNHA